MDPSGNPESPANAPLDAALKDAVSLFESLHIPYALIGGIAAMLYGRLRATEDVDFVCAADHPQILATNPQVMQAHHFDPACTWKLYHASGVEIDIWKDQYSDDIVARAQLLPFAGKTLRVADPHDLIAMKLRANRVQDDYDISQILSHTTIDEARLQSLVTKSEFAHYQSIKART
jgi:hypothetical protein